ncbi:MAG: alpha/beta hydrolase [Candidatus Gracilibacteria bacterium]|nr:alpha/beta hydrolase [Candidatus Gracilibacteria bacterium]
MSSVFIFHGVGGYPTENWFPWMKNRVEGLGLPAARLSARAGTDGNDVVGQAALAKEVSRVFVPQFPTPEGQTLQNWLEVLDNYQEYLDEDTILIGHSLGVPFTLNVLERYQAKAAFLVAGFVGKAGNDFDESMKTFAQRDFDWEKIKANCPNFTVFHSDNDPYVPLAKGREVAEKLGADFVLIPGAGHFNQAAGYTEFPELLERVKKLFVSG